MSDLEWFHCAKMRIDIPGKNKDGDMMWNVNESDENALGLFVTMFPTIGNSEFHHLVMAVSVRWLHFFL